MEDVVFVRSCRKTLSLSVNREGQVVVKMPYGMSKSRAIGFLELHREWVERQIALKNMRLDLSDGAEISIFGENCVLATGKTARKNNILYLPKDGRDKAFAEYLIGLAQTNMRAITEEIATQYSFSYRCVRISHARGRWGSCSTKGNISFSFRIAFLPIRVIYAVAVHELCHTRYMNHSSAFWKEVEKIVPNYSAVRKELKKYEFVMNSL